MWIHELLRWFLARLKCDLRWSLLVNDVAVLIMHSKFPTVFSSNLLKKIMGFCSLLWHVDALFWRPSADKGHTHASVVRKLRFLMEGACMSTNFTAWCTKACGHSYIWHYRPWTSAAQNWRWCTPPLILMTYITEWKWVNWKERCDAAECTQMAESSPATALCPPIHPPASQ